MLLWKCQRIFPLPPSIRFGNIALTPAEIDHLRNVPEIADILVSEKPSGVNVRLDSGEPPKSRLWTRAAVAGRVIFVMATAVLGGLFAVSKLLTTFRDYDDEGYILLSLKHYLTEGHLYTDTFSQYGPFYYFAQKIFLGMFHLPVTHDVGRLVTLVYWLASGLFAGLFVNKISKSLLLGCAAGLSCIIVGWVLANEPGHPQQVLLLVFMASTYFSVPGSSGRMSLRLAFLGAMGAELAFTKVNVGVFYVAALAHALLCVVEAGWIRDVGLSLSLIYAAAVPWLLMHADFDRGVQDYCLLAILSGTCTFVLGLLLRCANPKTARALLHALLGFLAAALSIVIAALLQGISLHTLIQGVILDPTRHHNVFLLPLRLHGDVLEAATAVSAGLIGLWLLRTKLGNSGMAVDAIRCVVGVASVLLLLRSWNFIRWLLPFLPLSLIPGTRQKVSAMELFPRIFITDLAATQFLEAYPVAGSQLAIAASPILLWAFVCIVDGIAGLRTAWERADRPAFSKVPLDLAAATLLMAAMAGTTLGAIRDLRQLPPRSGLRGSSLLHLAPGQERDYEFIAQSLGANCTILFTMPGMGSFNFWSGVPTPDGSNLTAWMKGLGADRQQQILDRLRAAPDACVLYNPALVRFWQTNQRDLAALPLAQYILVDMPKIAARGPYEIRVHPQRKSIWHSADGS